MDTKKIIILVAVIFIAFVGYKIIASNIQENKEKAVLQEKYKLEQLQNDQDTLEQKQTSIQLTSCLSDAQIKASTTSTQLGLDTRCDKYKNSVDAETACMKGVINVQNQIIEQLNQDKSDCYKRYK